MIYLSFIHSFKWLFLNFLIMPQECISLRVESITSDVWTSLQNPVWARAILTRADTSRWERRTTRRVYHFFSHSHPKTRCPRTRAAVWSPASWLEDRQLLVPRVAGQQTPKSTEHVPGCWLLGCTTLLWGFTHNWWGTLTQHLLER